MSLNNYFHICLDVTKNKTHSTPQARIAQEEIPPSPLATKAEAEARLEAKVFDDPSTPRSDRRKRVTFQAWCKAEADKAKAQERAKRLSKEDGGTFLSWLCCGRSRVRAPVAPASGLRHRVTRRAPSSRYRARTQAERRRQRVRGNFAAQVRRSVAERGPVCKTNFRPRGVKYQGQSRVRGSHWTMEPRHCKGSTKPSGASGRKATKLAQE